MVGHVNSPLTWLCVLRAMFTSSPDCAINAAETCRNAGCGWLGRVQTRDEGGLHSISTLLHTPIPRFAPRPLRAARTGFGRQGRLLDINDFCGLEYGNQARDGVVEQPDAEYDDENLVRTHEHDAEHRQCKVYQPVQNIELPI